MTGKTETEPSPRSYSIRLPASSSWVCAACGDQDTGGGPVGHRGERPLCDRCLLEASPPLGMVMALIAVTRACGAMAAPASGDWQAALRQLGIFARVYECFAAKSGPRRAFRLSGEAPATGREKRDADR